MGVEILSNAKFTLLIGVEILVLSNAKFTSRFLDPD